MTPNFHYPEGLDRLALEELERLRQPPGILAEINRIADQLANAVTGSFDFNVQVVTAETTVQKLGIMLNFLLETIRRTLSEIDKKNNEILAKEKVKAEFFAGVSHELRTPLTLILGPLESVLAGEYGNLEPAMSTCLGTAHNSAVRLLQLVNGLLDFSKLDAGKMQVKREPTDLVALTNSILSDFAPLLRQQSLALKCDVPREPLWVMMDRHLYERIFFNLLSNAVKFTLKSGVISVHLSQIGSEILLSVQDTGIGIAAEDLPKLFQKFSQLEGSSTRRFEGTGLGLSLVQEFSTILDGGVRVSSELGKGSTFTVTLQAQPARRPEGDRSAERRPLVSQFHFGPLPLGALSPSNTLEAPRAKIVVAEDNSELAAYIESLITPLARVRLARDGEEALQLVRSWSPDLVLADVMMPICDGFSLCRELKADSRLSQIPVVLLTALTHREALLQGWEVGADEYLYKPFHPRELVTRIKSLLTMVQVRKKAEEQRLRIEELERFTSIASHDLKEPLRNIQVFSQLLNREYRANLDDKAEQYLDYVTNNARRMQALLNDLISYAMVGTEAVTLGTVPLERVVTRVKQNLQITLEESGAQLELKGAPLVTADESQLGQVLQNLVSNAIKFRKPGVSPKIQIEVKEYPREWEIGVSDNGIGIEAEYLETIFLIFRRLNPSEQYPGSGMGLAICRRLIESLGGRMWVQSKPGEGTVFTFSLPRPGSEAPALGNQARSA